MKATGSEYPLDPILLIALTVTLAVSPSGRSSNIRSYVISVKLVADKLVTFTTPPLLH